MTLVSDKNKKEGHRPFWLKVAGLAVLGLGLLARNAIVILIATVLLLIFWSLGKRDKESRKKIRFYKIFSKIKKDKKDKKKKQTAKDKHEAEKEYDFGGKISGPSRIINNDGDD